MAIKIKKIEKGDGLTLWEKSYLPEIIRGLGITLSHFATNMKSLVDEFALGKGRDSRTIMTLYYPEEQPVIPPAYRGRPVLVSDKNGVEKCVACGLCEAACPPACIHILGGERDNGDRFPRSYVLDGSRCIFCGLCEEACPKEAIVMSDEWRNLCQYDRTKMIYEKETLLRSEAQVQKRLDFIRSNSFSRDRY